MGRRRLNEIGRRADTNEIVIRLIRYFRPTEVDLLQGDPRKLSKNWAEMRISLEELVEEMIIFDKSKAKEESL